MILVRNDLRYRHRLKNIIEIWSKRKEAQELSSLELYLLFDDMLEELDCKGLSG